jgi:hypothetical protein
MADLSAGEAAELLDVSKAVLGKAAELRDFISDHRDLARQAGIETIAAEVSGMLDGERLRRVHDALAESVARDRPARLTEEGLGQLRRAEAMLADAAKQIARHTEYELSEVEGLRARRDRERETERELLELEEERLELARREARIREVRARLDLEDRTRRIDRMTASSLGFRRAPSPALENATLRLGAGQEPVQDARLEAQEPPPARTDWLPVVVIAVVGAVGLLIVALASGGGAPARGRRRR